MQPISPFVGINEQGLYYTGFSPFYCEYIKDFVNSGEKYILLECNKDAAPIEPENQRLNNELTFDENHFLECIIFNFRRNYLYLTAEIINDFDLYCGFALHFWQFKEAPPNLQQLSSLHNCSVYEIYQKLNIDIGFQLKHEYGIGIVTSTCPHRIKAIIDNFTTRETWTPFQKGS